MGELYNPFPKLPKNIRQIGEGDTVVRLYVEDYVNTYLKRLYPTGKQTLRAGVLLGSMEQHDGTPYIFVDGALEMEDLETDGEKLIFSESSWKKAYQGIEESFPKRTIQGWFLCAGPGSQLSPLNYWKQHNQFFAGKNQIMYLNQGLDGEESIYITSEDGFYRLRGHYIYYERNQMMQDYMITRKDVRRIESGSHEHVIKDFRQRMVSRREQADMHQSTANALGMLCGVLSVAVLAGGVVLFNNYNKMQKMESVIASVLPAGVSDWDEYQKQKAQEPDFVIEEMPGEVYPTETMTGENGETAVQETVSGEPAEGETAAGESGAGETEEAGAGGEQVQAAAEDEVEEAVPGSSAWDSTAGPSSGEGDSGVSGNHMTGEQESSNLVGMGKTMGQGDEGDGENAAEPVPAMDYEAAEANGYTVYEVGEGETLYGICWSVYGNLSHLSEICSLNGLSDENRILAGQKLILP